MGIIEYLIIGIGIIAVALLLVTIVRRISAYYRQHYNVSIWSGVLLVIIACTCVAYSILHYDTPNIVLLIVAGIIFIAMIFLDIHHAGVGMGLLALLLQMVLSVAFVAVIVGAILLFAIRSIRQGDDLVVDALTGTTSGFRNGVSLFFRFFVP